MPEFQLRAGRAHMTPKQAWLYAAAWGSFIRAGDPGACMYGFDESFTVQSQKHRADCLAWIENECRPEVLAHPDSFRSNELAEMDSFISALKAAPVAGSDQCRDEWAAFNTLDSFTRGYIEALFFTDQAPVVTSDEWRELEEAGIDDMGGSFPSDLGFHDLAPESLERIEHDCGRFQRVARRLLAIAYSCGDYDAEQAGRDFWFTRNGRGAGFRDREQLRDGALGDRLSRWCGRRTRLGEVWTYFGDDGKVHL